MSNEWSNVTVFLLELSPQLFPWIFNEIEFNFSNLGFAEN